MAFTPARLASAPAGGETPATSTVRGVQVMTGGLEHIGSVSGQICALSARRRQLLEYLRGRGMAVRLLPEIMADLGRRNAVAVRADLDALEADRLIWRRDMVHAPDGFTITEPVWWAGRGAHASR